MKHLEHNQEFRLNEILFQNRNKAYGAYVLRNESDRILTKALVIGASLLASVAVTPLLINAFKTTEVHVPVEPVYRPVDVDIIPAEPEKPKTIEVVKPVEPAPPPSVKQFDSQVVIPTREADESKLVKEIPKDAVAGIKNDFEAEPADQNIHIPVTANSGQGTIAQPKIIPAAESDSDDAVKNPDILAVNADFEGGMNAFRNKVMNKFDVSSFQDEGSISTTVTFVVEKDGTISNIKTNGKDAGFNAEAVRTIKAVKGKWIPGKNKKGEPVRSIFKFPISMKFDN